MTILIQVQSHRSRRHRLISQTVGQVPSLTGPKKAQKKHLHKAGATMD
ncbi:MAG: hypothetical protein E6Z06_08635 [Clostridiales bacterium]|nr:hypothetical protein [Clostridiales bacterium]